MRAECGTASLASAGGRDHPGAAVPSRGVSEAGWSRAVARRRGALIEKPPLGFTQRRTRSRPVPRQLSQKLSPAQVTFRPHKMTQVCSSCVILGVLVLYVEGFEAHLWSLGRRLIARVSYALKRQRLAACLPDRRRSRRCAWRRSPDHRLRRRPQEFARPSRSPRVRPSGTPSQLRWPCHCRDSASTVRWPRRRRNPAWSSQASPECDPSPDDRLAGAGHERSIQWSSAAWSCGGHVWRSRFRLGREATGRCTLRVRQFSNGRSHSDIRLVPPAPDRFRSGHPAEREDDLHSKFKAPKIS